MKELLTIMIGARYIENFKLFESGCPPEVIAAGPRRLHD